MYHKSDIKATVADLDKLTTTGERKKGVTTLACEFLYAIAQEKQYMRLAYDKMKCSGMDLNSATFESVISGLKNPVLQLRIGQSSVVERFRRYAEESLRDHVIGKRRYDHIIVVSDKLERFLIIKGLSEITASEFTDSLLMELRNFIFDEYKYVDNYQRLYTNVSSHNKPKARLSINTVATQMKMFQAFFSELESSDEIIKSPFRRLGKGRKRVVMKTRYDDPVFLRSDEFQTVLSAEVPPALRDARDAFLLLCAFGCRISDFVQLSIQNIRISSEGIPYIHYIPLKTANIQTDNNEVETPIVRYAFDIILRSRFDFPILKNIYGSTGFNQKIKDLLKYCKICREVPVYNEETSSNDYLPLFKVGSSKLARKTHVDMMNKIQIDLYAAGLHKKGSASVRRYTFLELKDRFNLMNAAFNQKPYRVDSNLNIIEE